MDEKYKGYCLKCEKRERCKTPCDTVKKLLWEDNRIMERQSGNGDIHFYSKSQEVPFSELEDYQIEHFTEDDIVPWSSEDLRLTQCKVFVERFFNKVPCKDLAEKFNVKENTIVCMYQQAVKQLEKVIEILDSRKSGIKAVTASKFTDEQKYFLLACIFGFTKIEVAEMFNRDPGRVAQKINRLEQEYGNLFEGKKVKEEKPIEDPPIKEKLTRPDVVNLVDKYVDQGLSQGQAFKRIANRFSEVVNRPVNYKGIASRYYKAMAA
jgi:DNA-directed RNA polymerase specialized sigma24 family protein